MLNKYFQVIEKTRIVQILKTTKGAIQNIQTRLSYNLVSEGGSLRSFLCAISQWNLEGIGCAAVKCLHAPHICFLFF